MNNSISKINETNISTDNYFSLIIENNAFITKNYIFT